MELARATYIPTYDADEYYCTEGVFSILHQKTQQNAQPKLLQFWRVRKRFFAWDTSPAQCRISVSIGGPLEEKNLRRTEQILKYTAV